MKKLTLIGLFAGWTIVAMAQPRLHQPEMYIGAHGGVIFSMALFTPDVPGTKQVLETALMSGQGGIIFRYAGHKCCGLQVELDYLQRGWREKIDVEGEDASVTSVHYQRKLDYLELPFMAHIFFGKKMVRGFFNVGPQVGVCFHESWSGTQHPTMRAQYAKLDHIVDWGIAGGVGMTVRTPKAGSFQLEARFTYSLGDYFLNTKTDYFSNSNPICLSVNVGYLWEIKPKQKNNKGVF